MGDREMSAQELIEAIAELRRVTPANDPWDGMDFNSIPAPIDYTICTILNAVLSGDLIRADLSAAREAAARREGWNAAIEAAARVAEDIGRNDIGWGAIDAAAAIRGMKETDQ